MPPFLTFNPTFFRDFSSRSAHPAGLPRAWPPYLRSLSQLAGVTTNPGPAPTTTTTMKRTPRHTLLRIAAALTLLLPALTACTIVSQRESGPDEPITFASFLPDVTKAVVNNEEDMEDFAVWMYIDGAPSLEQERVYNADAASSSPLWTYDSKRFWTEGNYNFYALHPNPADGSGITAACTAYGITSITLNSPNADIDLMTATASRDYPLGGDGAVAFTFEHLLSRVSFVAATGSDNIIVNNLTLSGIAFSGTYASSGWVLDETSSISAVSGIAVSTSGTTDLLDMLLIPQTISAECILTLGYSADGQKVEKTLIIPASPEWVAGKSYVYTLMLHYTDATLTVSVEPWVVEDIAVQW